MGPQIDPVWGVGLSTLNTWVQKHQHDDLMIVIDPRDNGDARVKKWTKKTPVFAKKPVCCARRREILKRRQRLPK